MGTFLALQATGKVASEVESAIEAAFAAVIAVDHRMHPGAADSDLARISNSPLHTPVAVHPSTRELLTLARRLNVLTLGVFDPCLPVRTGQLSDVEIADDGIICHQPVALDFGGFAKGYAVDCAIEVLMRHGCTAGLVNAGGDLRVFGSPTEPVLLRSPSGELTELSLTDAALAVSDARAESRPAEHRGYYVRSGASLDSLADVGQLATNYAAVMARQAVIADALSKCVLLCPSETVSNVLREFDSTRLILQ